MDRREWKKKGRTGREGREGREGRGRKKTLYEIHFCSGLGLSLFVCEYEFSRHK